MPFLAPLTGSMPPSAPPAMQQQPNLYSTILGPQQEQQFQSWVSQNKIPWQDSPAADYDMRGFWKAMVSGDPNAKRAGNLHFPDTYKTPYHQTFSNQSIYSGPDAPHWEGDVLKNKAGKIIADERKK